MINHITLFVRDVQRSGVFYTKALAPLGYKKVADKSNRAVAPSIGYGTEDKNGMRDFWIKEKNNMGDVRSFSCFAFTALSKDAVAAFHQSALAAGGRDNGAPGYRTKYHPGYYAAYVLDPDGNNIEAVFDDPTPTV